LKHETPEHNRETDQTTAEDPVRVAEFVPLFSANARRIYTYILTLLPNRADAEEVFQEVSALLWQRFHEFEPGSNFGAWGCRIAYFKALHVIERRKLRPTTFSDTMLEMLDSAMLAMDESLDAEYQALADCMMKLNQNDREMIVLRYSEQGSPQRIAERFDRPVKSIYKSLDRIRRSLFECVMRKLATGE
jgi:RNA polymerase sigma-70 factor, ECF subfamily